MDNSNQLLISLEERHANNILSGKKTVELRRRKMHVEEGAIVWLYVKTPIAAVVGYAEVSDHQYAAPSTIWRKLGGVTGLHYKEFKSYFADSTKAFALGLKNPRALETPIKLTELRELSQNFQPPQFYLKVLMKSPLQRLLAKSITTKARLKKHAIQEELAM